MRDVEFLGMNCVCAMVQNKKLTKEMNLFEYTGSNLEFAKKQANGRFKILRENELVKQYLSEGVGIMYKDYVYFLKSTIETSPCFLRLNKKIERNETNLVKKTENDYMTYLNGVVYSNLVEKKHFSMVKSMINLYETQVFSKEMVSRKLEKYLMPEAIQEVFQELEANLQQVS